MGQPAQFEKLANLANGSWSLNLHNTSPHIQYLNIVHTCMRVPIVKIMVSFWVP